MLRATRESAERLCDIDIYRLHYELEVGKRVEIYYFLEQKLECADLSSLDFPDCLSLLPAVIAITCCTSLVYNGESLVHSSQQKRYTGRNMKY